MSLGQRVLTQLGKSGDWIAIDQIARALDADRAEVRAVLLISLNADQVENKGDRWRKAGG